MPQNIGTQAVGSQAKVVQNHVHRLGLVRRRTYPAQRHGQGARGAQTDNSPVWQRFFCYRKHFFVEFHFVPNLLIFFGLNRLYKECRLNGAEYHLAGD
jgi:hypothetical protein